MLEFLTVSLQCRCEMFEGIKEFVSNKVPQCIELSINDCSIEHQFTNNQEEVSLKLTAPIYQKNNTLSLKYKNVKQDINYGNTRILSLRFYGCDIGLSLFNSVYTSWHDMKSYPSYLYMGYPGEWKMEFASPVAKNYGGICFG